MKVFKKFLVWLQKWFWINPTKKVPEKKAHAMAYEAMKDWDVVNYNGTKIPFRIHEIAKFNALPRKGKRQIAESMKAELKKGRMIIVEIEGKDTVVLNRNYEARARKNIR